MNVNSHSDRVEEFLFKLQELGLVTNEYKKDNQTISVDQYLQLIDTTVETLRWCIGNMREGEEIVKDLLKLELKWNSTQ